MFGEVHLELMAAARRDDAALAAGLARLNKTAARGHQGAPVAAAFFHAPTAMRQGDADATQRHWQQLLPQLPRVGGSHAQRAVVELTHQAGRLAQAQPVVQPPVAP